MLDLEKGKKDILARIMNQRAEALDDQLQLICDGGVKKISEYLLFSHKQIYVEENEELLIDNEKLKEEKEKRDAEVKELKKQNDELLQNFEKLENKNKSLLNVNDKIRKKISFLNGNYKKYREIIDNIKQEHIEIEKKFNIKFKEIKNASKASTDELIKIIKRLKEKIGDLDNEKVKSQGEIHELELKKQKLENEIEGLDKKKEEKLQIEKNIHDLLGKKNELEKNLREITENLEKIKEDIKIKEKEKWVIQSKLEEEEAKLSKFNNEEKPKMLKEIANLNAQKMTLNEMVKCYSSVVPKVNETIKMLKDLDKKHEEKKARLDDFVKKGDKIINEKNKEIIDLEKIINDFKVVINKKKEEIRKSAENENKLKLQIKMRTCKLKKINDEGKHFCESMKGIINIFNDTYEKIKERSKSSIEKSKEILKNLRADIKIDTDRLTNIRKLIDESKTEFVSQKEAKDKIEKELEEIQIKHSELHTKTIELTLKLDEIKAQGSVAQADKKKLMEINNRLCSECHESEGKLEGIKVDAERYIKESNEENSKIETEIKKNEEKLQALIQEIIKNEIKAKRKKVLEDTLNKMKNSVKIFADQIKEITRNIEALKIKCERACTNCLNIIDKRYKLLKPYINELKSNANKRKAEMNNVLKTIKTTTLDQIKAIMTKCQVIIDENKGKMAKQEDILRRIKGKMKTKKEKFSKLITRMWNVISKQQSCISKNNERSNIASFQIGLSLSFLEKVKNNYGNHTRKETDVKSLCWYNPSSLTFKQEYYPKFCKVPLDVKNLKHANNTSQLSSYISAEPKKFASNICLFGQNFYETPMLTNIMKELEMKSPLLKLNFDGCTFSTPCLNLLLSLKIKTVRCLILNNISIYPADRDNTISYYHLREWKSLEHFSALGPIFLELYKQVTVATFPDSLEQLQLGVALNQYERKTSEEINNIAKSLYEKTKGAYIMLHVQNTYNSKSFEFTCPQVKPKRYHECLP